MASEVEICNRALQRLGAGRIVALDGANKESRECNTAYAPLRDFLLRSHPWSFAIQRAALAADVDAPIGDDAPDAQYTWPTDALRILLPKSASLDWIIEGRKILTSDTAPLYIRYVARITDPNTMDPMFREALACLIGFEICESITQSNTKKAGLRDDLRDIIAEARRTNAIEKPPVESADDTWDTDRL